LWFPGFQTICHQLAGFGHLPAYMRTHKPFFPKSYDRLCPFVEKGNQAAFISGNDTMIAELEDLMIISILHALFLKSAVNLNDVKFGSGNSVNTLKLDIR
jgi:hypothetical protein